MSMNPPMSIPPTRPRVEGRGGLTHRTLNGLFWMFVGSGLQAVLQLLVLIILARLLTPVDFGVVAAVQVVVGFTTIFSQLGVGPAIVQRPGLEPRHVRTAFTLSLLFGFMMSGMVWLLAPLLGAFYRMDSLTPVARGLSLVFAVQGTAVVPESLLQRDLKFRRLATIELIAYGLGFGIVGIGLAFMQFGVWALVAAQLTQMVTKASILLILQPHPKRFLMERRALGELMYFGGGFTMARVGNYIAGQVDNLVVGRWLGAAALGVYGRAYQLMTAPANFFGQILDRVLFPAMARVQEESERMSTAYRRGVALIALLILPVSVVLLILAPEVIRLVLGPKWTEVTVPFQVFAAGMLLRTSYKMSDSVARATAAMYRRAWRQAIYAGLVATGAWVGQFWGLEGVAYGVLAAIAVNFLLMAQLSVSLKAVSWRVLWSAHIPALILAGILGAQTWALAEFLRRLSTPASILVGGVALAGILTAVALVRFAPRLVLGDDGIWMGRTLTAYLPAGLSFLQQPGLTADAARGSGPC